MDTTLHGKKKRWANKKGLREGARKGLAAAGLSPKAERARPRRQCRGRAQPTVSSTTHVLSSVLTDIKKEKRGKPSLLLRLLWKTVTHFGTAHNITAG